VARVINYYGEAFGLLEKILIPALFLKVSPNSHLKLKKSFYHNPFSIIVSVLFKQNCTKHNNGKQFKNLSVYTSPKIQADTIKVKVEECHRLWLI
jgi:hypothetical protein